MKFNNLKRKAFFWVEKLQISRTERISVVTLLVLLIVLFTLNLFLQHTYNYNQDQYDAITAEFNKRSEALKQEQKELARKYNPELLVGDTTGANTDKMKAAGDELQNSVPETKMPSATEKININTATKAQLQSLKGIGDTYAQRIIEYRKTHGNFKTLEELVNVKGIGKKRLENIRPFITL